MRAKRASLVFLFLILAVYPANAQDFDFEDNLSKGMEALDSGQYELAIKYLEPCEKIVSQDTTKEAQEFDDMMLRILANSHAELGNYKKAIEFVNYIAEISEYHIEFLQFKEDDNKEE